MTSQLLDIAALQMHRQLEDGHPLWAADWTGTGNQWTGLLEEQQELGKHYRAERRRYRGQLASALTYKPLSAEHLLIYWSSRRFMTRFTASPFLTLLEN